MTELMRIIQAHLDRYGVSRAEFARRAGATPQTVQNWRDRLSSLPHAKHLRGVAEVTGVPYLIVLDAAMVDAGYRDGMVDDVAAMRARLDQIAAEHPEVLAEIRAYAADLERDYRDRLVAESEDPQVRVTADLIAKILREQLGGEVGADVEADDGDNGGQRAR